MIHEDQAPISCLVLNLYIYTSLRILREIRVGTTFLAAILSKTTSVFMVGATIIPDSHAVVVAVVQPIGGLAQKYIHSLVHYHNIHYLHKV